MARAPRRSLRCADVHLIRSLDVHLIRRIAIDRERLDFALWAVDQPNRTPTPMDWGGIYIEGNAVADDAVRAFDGLRHDQTVSDAEGEWFFDPWLLGGWMAWHAAKAHVRAMALAVHQRDAVALSSLAGAFDSFGLPGDYVRPSAT